jgi:molecular chaperone GrpE
MRLAYASNVDIFGLHLRGGSHVSDNEPKATDSTQGAQPSGAAEGAPAGAGDTLDTLKAKLEESQAEALKVRDQLLRTAADFDNFRKRARKDVEDAQRKSLERVLLEMLPVSDNLERAVQAATGTTDVAPVVEGITMVLRFFEDALARLGVERVGSVGQGFDPALHEAVQQVETTEHPAGTVIAELAPGYRYQGKLLRAAMVAVARPPAN